MTWIHELLDGNLIIEDLQATDKMGVIREFAALLHMAGKVKDEGELVRVVLERESQGSTGIGEGIAIPHAKSHAISEMVVAFGRYRSGVDFQSLDGKPAYLFFLLVTPEKKPEDHLKTLARLSRIMRNHALREQLRCAAGRLDLQRLILDEDRKYSTK